MKNFIDNIYRKKFFIAFIVITIVLFNGFLRYNQEKKAIEKEKERIILGSLTNWFHGMSLQHIDGKEGFYIVEDKIDDEIMVYIDKWNNEGLTAFVDLKELAKDSVNFIYPYKSEEELREIIVDEINRKILVEEQNEAMTFMVKGWKAEDTKYKSVLEIEGELFMVCEDKLNDLIVDALELQSHISIRYDWIDMLRGK